MPTALVTSFQSPHNNGTTVVVSSPGDSLLRPLVQTPSFVVSFSGCKPPAPQVLLVDAANKLLEHAKWMEEVQVDILSQAQDAGFAFPARLHACGRVKVEFCMNKPRFLAVVDSAGNVERIPEGWEHPMVASYEGSVQFQYGFQLYKATKKVQAEVVCIVLIPAQAQFDLTKLVDIPQQTFSSCAL